MFAARSFCQNLAAASLATLGARAFSTKTTTIKG
jgi:hypothetical protein